MTKYKDKHLIQLFIAGTTMQPASAKPAKLKLTSRNALKDEKNGAATLSITTHDVERVVLIEDIEAVFIPPKKKIKQKQRWNPKYWLFYHQCADQDDFKSKLKDNLKASKKKKGIVFLNDAARVMSIYYRFSTAAEVAQDNPTECCDAFKSHSQDECCDGF